MLDVLFIKIGKFGILLLRASSNILLSASNWRGDRKGSSALYTQTEDGVNSEWDVGGDAWPTGALMQNWASVEGGEKVLWANIDGPVWLVESRTVKLGLVLSVLAVMDGITSETTKPVGALYWRSHLND